MKFSFATFLLSLFIITGCSKEDAGNSTVSSVTSFNVAYGTDPLQKMDIYLPANRNETNTPVIILIHGGGWTTGDKSASTRYVDSLKRRMPEYAVFNINYRLSAIPLNVFPTQEEDIKQAVEYIYNNRGQYIISDNFVLIGESAGGHLSMLHAYKYNSPVKVKAVVSFFGPTDITDLYNNPVNGNPLISAVIADAVGATPTSNPGIYLSSSPVNFISASTAVPTILFHGGMDPLVSPAQSAEVYSRLQNLQIASDYHLYPLLGHGDDWSDATFFDAFNKTEAFLEANVQ